MKRVARTIFLFLLLGAILNVAVAWGCASRARYTWIIGTLVDARPDGDMVFSLRGGFGSQEIEVSAQTGGYFDDGEWTPRERFPEWIPSWSSVASVSVKDLLKSGYWRLAQTANGWPMRSLQWEARDHCFHSLNEPDQPLAINHGLLISPTHNVVLPVAPIWPGFAINTIFYAAILSGGWLPFAALGAFRRRRRIKRGLCPKCGYDLRGSTSQTCPECGKTKKTGHSVLQRG